MIKHIIERWSKTLGKIRIKGISPVGRQKIVNDINDNAESSGDSLEAYVSADVVVLDTDDLDDSLTVRKLQSD